MKLLILFLTSPRFSLEPSLYFTSYLQYLSHKIIQNPNQGVSMTPLTSRELEIIRYSAEGCTAKEIARLTGLEHRTIESYVMNIRKKLSARNTTHAVFLAMRQYVFMVQG
jgi:DNA-binding NarL/FixJ family response regulator